jgi:hypothetical protein
MKKLLAGGLALGLAGVGAAILAGPTGAQEPAFDVVEHVDAELTPTIVGGGETVTVTSVDPCPQPPEVEEPTDELIWAFGATGWLNPEDPSDQPGDLVGEGTAPVAEDGTWEVTFQAPETSGAYEFFAICLAADAPAGESVDDVVEDAAEAAAQVAPEAVDSVQGFAGTGDEDHEGPDHTLPTVPCSQQPCDTTPPPTEPPPPPTEPTIPPDFETAVYLYGPEAFTVQGAPAPAVPVSDEPEFTG